MTKKNQSPAASAAAKKPLAKTAAQPPRPPEPPAPSVDMTIQAEDVKDFRATQSDLAPAQSPLAQAALAWMLPDTDPKLDVADARAAVRASTGAWPTVLRLSPQVFDDACNHPAVVAYLALAQLQHSYDCMRGPSAKPFLAYYFGCGKVEVVPDEPAASLQ